MGGVRLIVPEVKFGRNADTCENCGRQRRFSMVIERHLFCSSLCYTEWKWKKKRGEPSR